MGGEDLEGDAAPSCSDNGSAYEHATEELATVTMCPVCLSKPRDMAFGCGHQTCSECGPQVADCPICRRPIDTRVKLY
uniref:RING-type domain-containing protein n=1 Tax=Sorghum bicolor TaxID=4558 RepID=C6JRM4_SORBI